MKNRRWRDIMPAKGATPFDAIELPPHLRTTFPNPSSSAAVQDRLPFCDAPAETISDIPQKAFTWNESKAMKWCHSAL